jgi:putative addiction module antidote
VNGKIFVDEFRVIFYCYYIRNNKVAPMHAFKLTAIGNSVGVILPKEVLDKLHLAKGDTVYLTESPEGYRLTPYNPEFEKQMSVARQIMKKRRDVLHELAK